MKYFAVFLIYIAVVLFQTEIRTFLGVTSAQAQESWVEPYVYDIGKEVYASECTVLGCNLTPALQRATAACEVELNAQPDLNRRYTGCKFLLPAGDHTISETISSCRAHDYEGRSGRHRRSLTSISSPVTAFHGRGFGDCAASGFGSTSAGAISVRNLGLKFPSGAHTTKIVGVKAEAKIHLEEVYMIYPDVGVWITADVTRTPKSNANASRLINVAVEYTRHASFIFNGGDSNAHAILAPNGSTACMAKYDPAEMAALEAEFGPCGGYVDRSFLGNFAVAGHFAAAADYPDILISGASNHGTCLGCYVEGATPVDLAAPWSMWLGGKGPGILGTGFRLDGSMTNTLQVTNDMDPANVVTVQMGRASNSNGAYWTLKQSANNWPLRMKFNKTLNNGSYLEDVANSSLGRVRSIRATRDGTPPPGGDSDALGRTKHWDVEDILQP